MTNFNIEIFGADYLNTVITDLLASNEQAYNFIISLYDQLEGQARQATATDLSNLAKFVEQFNGIDNYYASELLYMLDVAFTDVSDN